MKPVCFQALVKMNQFASFTTPYFVNEGENIHVPEFH